tara:strand:+ start:648 stop:878 length:231 start_codon:yes stop_codon:yes gene_type:complete
MSINVQPSPPTLLRIGEVIARTGLARSTVYQLIGQGQFPAPIPLHGRTRAFVASDVDAWVQARIDAAKAAPTRAKQ